MADKKLNAVDSATTVANFYGNNGGQDVQIPLAAAASVLAASMGFEFKFRGSCLDANTIDKDGYYDLASTTDIPNSPVKFGTIIMFYGRYPTQIIISTSNSIHIRVNANSEWTEWRAL